MSQYKFFSRKTICMSILVLFLGVSIGIYLTLRTRTSKADFLENLVENAENQELKDDLDHDGLKNWEEEIYKTDPNNPDTDGDGYLDGEEVATGFDPAIPAPDDEMQSHAVDRPDPGNLTQSLAYVLGQKFQAGAAPSLLLDQDITTLLQQQLNDIADDDVKDALQKTTANFLAEFIPPFEKETPFKTTDKKDQATLSEYGQETNKTLNQLTASYQILASEESLYAVVEKNVSSQNFGQTKQLAEIYSRAYSQLSQATVPLVYLNTHEQIASFVWRMYKTLKYLPEVTDDPFKGVIALQILEQGARNFIAFTNQLQEQLQQALQQAQ